SDMITSGITLPASYGISPPVRNFGKLEANGWELRLDFNHEFSNGLYFKATGSLSDAREQITRFSSPTKNIDELYEGRHLGEIWGFKTDRLFQRDDFSGKN